MKDQGYIQVYTGNGKGKTTCALGLSLRATCAGYKVFFGQFMKGQTYSEINALKLLPGFQMQQFGEPDFLSGKPKPENFEQAKHGLAVMKQVLISGEYDVVIFDEINTTLFFQLLEVEDVLAILDLKPAHTEVVLTGRYAPQAIIDRADLVTEMKEIKHYYNAGVPARVGIEK